MKSLNIVNVLDILSRTLNCIDIRLVDHGQRVAYIVRQMLRQQGKYTEEQQREICIVTMLHDIGAYKTEEINDMVVFESKAVLDHSIYGYLFLKNLSPLSNLAEIILYHHINYGRYGDFLSDQLELADLVHLADRMDILLQKGENWRHIEYILSLQNKSFSKEAIELFVKANSCTEIERKIRSGAYADELKEFVSGASYSEETLISFIRMIAFVIDFRSESTVSHVITTVSISMELARILNLQEEDLKCIFLGAYLHDIGKISIPLKILEKPGSLSAEEMKVMRSHILNTEKILTGEISEEIVQISCRHHERIDGSGYPKGLAGEQLTLSQRIVAVADVISALNGKRSYKESFDKQRIMDILREQKEQNKLCSVVTDTVLEHYDVIMKNSYQKAKATLEMYCNMRQEFLEIKKRME